MAIIQDGKRAAGDVGLDASLRLYETATGEPPHMIGLSSDAGATAAVS
jgi:hypothetical protein